MQISIKGDGKYFTTECVYKGDPNMVFPGDHAEVVIKPTPHLIELLEYIEVILENDDR